LDFKVRKRVQLSGYKAWLGLALQVEKRAETFRLTLVTPVINNSAAYTGIAKSLFPRFAGYPYRQASHFWEA
jgi:hypothetical protein